MTVGSTTCYKNENIPVFSLPLSSGKELGINMDRTADIHMALPFTGVVLAGGKSRRMGQSKAQMALLGKSLLERQVDKLHRAGASEILLSGESCRPLPNTRVVADVLPERGPLGGLHACLQTASYPYCLVLSVDVPLVPVETLRQLRAAHTGGITVLRHGAQAEPLIGVYDSALAPAVFSLIESSGVPVRSLQSILPWHYMDYRGDDTLLCNCNTPQEFEEMERIALTMYGKDAVSKL